MTIKRRDFLKGIAGGAALAILPDISNARDKAESPRKLSAFYMMRPFASDAKHAW